MKYIIREWSKFRDTVVLKELAELTCCVIVIADLLADSFGLGKTTNFKPKLFSTAGVNLASKDIIP